MAPNSVQHFRTTACKLAEERIEEREERKNQANKEEIK
jgi:hypothetical protein